MYRSSGLPSWVVEDFLAGAHWGIVLRIVQAFLTKHKLGYTELILLNGPESDIIIKPRWRHVSWLILPH